MEDMIFDAAGDEVNGMRDCEVWKDRCWAEIDLDVISQNIGAVRRCLPAGCALLAVVKGEGYGHGMLPVAQVCAEAGASCLGTATWEEAAALRDGGIDLPILVFGVTAPVRAPELAVYRLTQVVPSLDYARALARCLREGDRTLAVHLAVDTGMGRLGWWIEPETIPAVCGELLQVGRLRELRVEGLMTHLSSARGADREAVDYTRRQLEVFQETCREAERGGLRLTYKHALNSGGLIRHRAAAEELNMVRVGHLLYDTLPGGEALGIRPALELKTRVVYVKELPAGACVGYGRTYRLPRPARIAVLGIGSSDGYPAALSNRGRVLLHGRLAPVVGEVCMDQVMVDVTAIPETGPGDIATVVGRDGGAALTMADIDRQSGGALGSALSTCLKSRVPLCYRRGGGPAGYIRTERTFIRLDGREAAGEDPCR